MSNTNAPEWTGTGITCCPVSYTIHAAVLQQAQLWKSTNLLKYQDIIHRAYNFYLGSSRLWYNEMFCMSVAINASLPWDRRDLGLWMELVTLDRPVCGVRKTAATY